MGLSKSGKRSVSKSRGRKLRCEMGGARRSSNE